MAPLVAAVVSFLVVFAFTGCAEDHDPLSEQYREGNTKGYIAGDGSVTQIPPSNRGAPVFFEGIDETGQQLSSTTYDETVLVVNFWYAACAPCRAEALTLETLYQQFSPHTVKFLGVNVRDHAATATAFNTTYGVTYPSIIDVNSGSMKLAFSTDVPPNAVPTTLVLDREKRVAARILGTADKSVLQALITDVLDESNAAGTKGETSTSSESSPL